MKFFSLIFAFSFCSVAFAEKSTSNTVTFEGADKLKKILQPLGSQVGFSLRDWNGKEVFAWHGREAYPPASVAKMVSSACSMQVLSPQFQFETQFGYTGTLSNGVIDGDFIVAGSGDPSFVIEDVKEMLEELYVIYGVREIRGKLIFDVSYLGTPALKIANGFEGDNGRAFTAELTAIPFNFNSFSIWVVPQNGVARIQTLPKDAVSIEIVNKVKVAGSGMPQIAVDYRPEQGKVLLSGNIPSGYENKFFHRSFPDPYAALAKTIFRVYGEIGGKWLSPKFKVETSAVNFSRLFRHYSRSLGKQLIDINKLSTNFGAEMVLLAAGAVQNGRPASLEKGRQTLENCISGFGISPEEITLENASGLSRKSTMQPSGLTLFLSKVIKTDFSPEYLSTLSVIGRDGTYRRRLQEFAGQARVKSGSLVGVNTLAGYILPYDRPPLIFSLFMKCPSCTREKLLQTEDFVVAALLR